MDYYFIQHILYNMFMSFNLILNTMFYLQCTMFNKKFLFLKKH